MPAFAVVRKKLVHWLRRYGPAEISGTIAALSFAWMTHQLTGSLAASAIAGVVAENIGYYGVICWREVRCQWQAAHMLAPARRLRTTLLRVARTIGLEFGVAELLDSFVVRPFLFYMVPTLLPGHTALGFLTAKLLADLVFYAWAILAY